MTIDDRTTPARTRAAVQSPPVPTTTRKVLRVALAVRGGVSMAVWIGGAVAELDLLRRVSLGKERCACDRWPPRSSECDRSATPRQKRAHLYRRRLTAAGYTEVEFDILAGASAGGLNAVLFALTQSFGYSTDHIVSKTWRTDGDLWDLVREPGRGAVPSILMGDGRLLQVAEKAATEIAHGPTDKTRGAAGEWAAAESVTVELAATLLTDKEQPEIGNRASFTFARRPGGLASRYSTIPGNRDGEAAPSPGLELGRMALAARATSSFPGAFEPAAIHSVTGAPESIPEEPDRVSASAKTAPTKTAWWARIWEKLTRKTSTAVESEPPPVLNMADVFPFARGPGTPDRLGQPDAAFRVIDGGVFDNIPIDRALRAVQRASAASSSRRVLLYLDPQPPRKSLSRMEAHMKSDGKKGDGKPGSSNSSDTSDAGTGWLAVIRSAGALQKRVESADDEIDEIRCHNEGVLGSTSRQRELAATLKAVLEAGREVRDVPVKDYFLARAGADVDRLSELIVDPARSMSQPPHTSRPYPHVDRVTALELGQTVRTAYEQIATSADSATALVLSQGDVGAAIGGVRLLIAWVQNLQALEVCARKPEAIPLRTLKRGLYRCLTVLIEARRITVDDLLVSGAPGDRVDCRGISERIVGGIVNQSTLALSPDVDRAITPDGSAAVKEEDFYAYLAPANTGDDGRGVRLDASNRGLAKIWDALNGYRDRILEWSVPEPQPGPAAERWSGSIYPLLHTGLVVDEGNPVYGLVRRVGTAAIPGTTSTIGFLRITGDTRSGILDETLKREGREVEYEQLAEIRSAAIAAQLQKWIRGDTDPADLPEDGLRDVVEETSTLARADTRLQGTGLARFAGFLSGNWRENDWHWGRLDASAGIVNMLAEIPEATDMPLDHTDPDLVATLQSEVMREPAGDKSQTSVGERLRETGGQTLANLPILYRFGLVSRVLPMVLRALWPSGTSSASVTGVLTRIGLVAVRPMLPIAALAVDAVRLVTALVLVVLASALLGTGRTVVGVQIVVIAVIAGLGAFLIYRASTALRRWRQVDDFFRDRGNPRGTEDDEAGRTTDAKAVGKETEKAGVGFADERCKLWSDTLAASRKPARRFIHLAMFAGVLALSVAVVWAVWSIVDGVPALGVESLVLSVALFAGLVWWCNRGAQTVRTKPLRPNGVRGTLICASVAGYAAVFVLTWFSVRDDGSSMMTDSAASEWLRRPGVAGIVAAATVLLLTLLSLWGWARWPHIIGWAAVWAVVAGVAQAGLESRWQSPLLDLLPVVVWAVGVGAVLQWVEPEELEEVLERSRFQQVRS